MDLHRVRWFFQDVWKAVKRALVIGIAVAFGFSIGWAGALSFVQGNDIHVDCTYGPEELVIH